LFASRSARNRTVMTIVRYVPRYKRPPRKKARTAEIAGPVVVKRSRRPQDPDEEISSASTDAPATEATPETGPVIVTARKPRGRSGREVPDLTPEELERRRDAADALFRELVRRATAKGKDQP
jgi:hypothetical protein